MSGTKQKRSAKAARIEAEFLAALDELATAVKTHGRRALDQHALPLPPLPVGRDEVRAAREALDVRPPVFALCLCVPVEQVEAWEAGREPVPDMARRLIDEIRHDPAYWRKRFGLQPPTG